MVTIVLLAVVGATWVVAATGFGWLVALLVPALALTVYIAWNTLRVLLSKGEEEKD